MNRCRMPPWNGLRMPSCVWRGIRLRKSRPPRIRGTTMWLPVRNFKPWQALPPMLADFINVHVCMMGALATPVLYLALQHQNDRATTRLAEAMAYYSSSFLLLSLLLPLAFLLNGFYPCSSG